MLWLFPMMLDKFDIFGCMWFFAMVAFLGFLFILFVVEETKGKNLDQLEEKGIGDYFSNIFGYFKRVIQLLIARRVIVSIFI